VNVIGLDHIVLKVSDAERSLAYYTEVLELAGERVEEWRRGEAPFPSVRIDDSTIIDLFVSEHDGANLDHFCLVLPTSDWEEMISSRRVEVLRGPSRVFGARGMGVSVYTCDPDGNIVELRHYPDGPRVGPI
jgi:catechol 2,3-dioxygenase-like lactoylglutathione lyase family enzyme